VVLLQPMRRRSWDRKRAFLTQRNISSTAHRITKGAPVQISMNLIASTGVVLMGTVLASAQSTAKKPNGSSVESSPSANMFERSASGNGVTVKVARQTAIWTTTTNGLSWLERSPNSPFRFYDVAFGNGIFVAVGNEGALVTSCDGASWTTRNSDTDSRLRGIAFGKNMFVAVGHEGTIITSKDGIKWTTRNSLTTTRLQMVAFDRDKFVVVGWKGVILTSSNGTRWQVRNSGISDRLDGITYRDGRFMASMTNRIVRVSTDGTTWAEPEPPPFTDRGHPSRMP